MYSNIPTGRHLHSKLKEALPMRRKHQAAFNALSATFPEQTIIEWKEMLAAWLHDTTLDNPFVETTLGNEKSLYSLRFSLIHPLLQSSLRMTFIRNS